MSLKKKQEERAEIFAKLEKVATGLEKETDVENQRSRQEEYRNLKAIKAKLDTEIESLMIVEDFKSSQESVNEQKQYDRHIRSKSDYGITFEDSDKALRTIVMNKLGFDVPSDFAEAADKLNYRNRQKIVLNTRSAQSLETKGSNWQVDVLAEKLIEKKKYYGPIWTGNNFYELVTPTNSVHKFLKSDSTTDDSYVLAHDENTEVDSATKELDQITSSAKAYATGVFPISYENIRDTSFPIWDFAAKSLAKDIARKEASLFTNGATSEHAGIVPGSTLGYQTTASSTAFAWTDVLELIKSIDYEVRQSPKFALMMNDSIYFEMLKWAEGTTNAPLYTNLVNGGEYKFHNIRILINNYMPSAAASNAKIMLAGDFDSFLIRRVGTVDIVPLNELLARQLSVGMVAWASSGCCVLDSANIKHLKMKSA